jgi:hypothetical protein
MVPFVWVDTHHLPSISKSCWSFRGINLPFGYQVLLLVATWAPNLALPRQCTMRLLKETPVEQDAISNLKADQRWISLKSLIWAPFFSRDTSWTEILLLWNVQGAVCSVCAHTVIYSNVSFQSDILWSPFRGRSNTLTRGCGSIPIAFCTTSDTSQFRSSILIIGPLQISRFIVQRKIWGYPSFLGRPMFISHWLDPYLWGTYAHCWLLNPNSSLFNP